MNRRQYLATVGMLTAGSAGAIGTGAFTSVQAERSVTVNVAGDSNAFLGLEPTSHPNSDYVHTTNGQVEIALDESDSGGSGFNKNAVTKIDRMLKVTNQGTQIIYFWIEHPNSGPFTVDNFWFYTDDSPNTKLHNGDAGDGNDYQVLTLSPGDSAKLGVKADFGDVSTDASFDGEVTFYANSTKPDGSGPVESGGDQALVVTKNPSGDNEYGTIQAAVDAADGTTILVEPGTYPENVSVNKSGVTVRGTTDPLGTDAAIIDGTLTASAPGVTVERLKLSPSTEYDIDAGMDPNILLANADDVVIRNNLLEGLRADVTGDGKSGSLNGIQAFDASQTAVSGIVIENNTIRDIVVDGDASAGWPNYGGAAAIKVQGTLDGVDVIENTVEDVYSAGWVWGIVMTHTGTGGYDNISPKDVTVKQNTVRELNTIGSQFDPQSDGNAPYVGNGFGIDGNSNANEATVTNNNFVQVPHGVQSKDTDNTLDVRNNWWGDSTGPSTGVAPVTQITDANTDEPADGDGSGISITDSNVDVRFDPWLNNSV